MFPNSFIALIPNADKDTIRKGNYRQLFMNIDAKTLNKMLTNSIQQCSRRILHYVKLALIPGMQDQNGHHQEIYKQ